MTEKQIPDKNPFPEFHLIDRAEMLESIVNLAHLACDHLHWETERARGASEMLDRLLLDPPSQASDTHSELYNLWSERGTDW
jgi:hypothetical protein